MPQIREQIAMVHLPPSKTLKYLFHVRKTIRNPSLCRPAEARIFSYSVALPRKERGTPCTSRSGIVQGVPVCRRLPGTGFSRYSSRSESAVRNSWAETMEPVGTRAVAPQRRQVTRIPSGVISAS